MTAWLAGGVMLLGIRDSDGSISGKNLGEFSLFLATFQL